MARPHEGMMKDRTNCAGSGQGTALEHRPLVEEKIGFLARPSRRSRRPAETGFVIVQQSAQLAADYHRSTQSGTLDWVFAEYYRVCRIGAFFITVTKWGRHQCLLDHPCR
jgi:hypothetical protein